MKAEADRWQKLSADEQTIEMLAEQE